MPEIIETEMYLTRICIVQLVYKKLRFPLCIYAKKTVLTKILEQVSII